MTSSSTPGTLLQLIKKGLTCPVCQGLYRDAQHLFSCNHTVCSECLSGLEDQNVEATNKFRNGRSRSSSSSKVCPVCGALEAPGNIGPALFFTNLIPDILSLESCLARDNQGIEKVDNRDGFEDLQNIIEKDHRNDGDKAPSLALSPSFHLPTSHTAPIAAIIDDDNHHHHHLQGGRENQNGDDVGDFINDHVGNALQEESNSIMSQEESQLLVDLPTFPPAKSTIIQPWESISKRYKTERTKELSQSPEHSVDGSTFNHNKAVIRLKENQNCQRINRRDNIDDEFHTSAEEETMLLSENEPEQLSVCQSESLASWGKDIMNSEANDIQAIIYEYNNDTDGSRSRNAKTQQHNQQEDLFSSSQHTITSTDDKELEYGLTGRALTTSLAGASEFSLPTSPILSGLSQQNRNIENDVDTMNQMSLASWGKDIEGSELLGIENMIEQQIYLQRKKRERLCESQVQFEYDNNGDGDEALIYKDHDKTKDLTRDDVAPRGAELTQSTDYKAQVNIEYVAVGYSELNAKNAHSLQQCESRGWVHVIDMTTIQNLSEVGNIGNIIWLVEEEENHYYKCRRTLTYLQALVKGQLIVSAEWLFDSICSDKDHLLRAYNYEISGSIEDSIVGAPNRSRKMVRDEKFRSTLFSGFSFQFVSLEDDHCMDFNDPNTQLIVHVPDELTVDKDHINKSATYSNQVNDDETSTCCSREVVSIENLVHFVHLCGGHVHTEKINIGPLEKSMDRKRLGILVPCDFLRIQSQSALHTKMAPKSHFTEVVSINWVLESIFNQHVFGFKEWRRNRDPGEEE